MWSKITLGFDIEEETVNFGGRRTAVCDSAVYETSTVAIVSREYMPETISEIVEPSRIRCSKFISKNASGIVIVVEESISVFSSDGRELKRQFSFPSTIDCYVVTDDGLFVFVALSCGELHCLLIPDNNCLLIQNVCDRIDEERTFTNMFVRRIRDEYNITLPSCNGNLYCVKGVSSTKLAKACVSGTKDNVDHILQTINQDLISLNSREFDGVKINASLEFYKFGEWYLLLVIQCSDRQEVQVWSTEFKLVCLLPLVNISRIKKIRTSKNGNLIFALTSQGSLIVIDPYTMIVIFQETRVSWIDFEVMNDEDCNLLVLTRDPENMLELVTIPGFKIKFRMNIGEKNYLAGNQSSFDDLFYLEAHYNETNDAVEYYESVHLKIISESQPEYRLERMLRRGKFEEAEEFSRKFDLNVEVVYKAHLQKLLQDVQPWTADKICVEESITKFKNLIQKIKDIEFVARCALNVISSDFNFVKDILKYVENRIKAEILRSDTKIDPVLFINIRNLLLLLNTFLSVCEKPLTVDKWLNFNKTNLIQECQSLLKQGLLRQVTLIWSRHVYELKNQLTLEHATYFIRNIPSSTPMIDALDWLQIFLPVSFNLFPSTLSNLVSWSKDKVSIMELVSEPNWMENGVGFLKRILNLIRTNVKPCRISSENIIQSEYGENSPLKDILFYIKVLNELDTMKKKYGVDVTMAEYTQESSEDIIFTILDKVPVEELNSFVKNFLIILILEKGLNEDVVISNYIQCLVEGSVNWWYWEEAPWETSVAVLIKCIISVEEKLKCILCILKQSPVPWSPMITQMCDDALKYNNPITKLIFEQKKLVACKLILKKYDLHYTKLTQRETNRILLYIFTQARSTMLEDALQVVNTFKNDTGTEVYEMYVQSLIENKESAKALSFLDDKTLSPKVVIRCCGKILLSTHYLSRTNVFSEKYCYYVDILDMVTAIMNKAISKMKAAGEVVPLIVSPDICKHLKNIHYVKTNYEQNITGRFFTERCERDRILENCLKENLKKDSENRPKLLNKHLKPDKMAKCFDYNREEIYIKYIELVLSENKIEEVVYLSKLLLKENAFKPKIAKKFIDLCQSILKSFVINPINRSEDCMAHAIQHFITQALVTCSPLVLSKGIEIRNWCRLIRSSQRDDYHLKISDNKVLPSYSTTTSWAVIINVIASYGVYLETSKLKTCVQYLPPFDQHRERLETTNLSDLLNRISEQVQETVGFPLMTTLHWSLLNNYVLSKQNLDECKLLLQTKLISKRCISKLLKKLIGFRHVDSEFGVALLHYFSKEEAKNWILESTKRFKYDFQRLYAVTELGIMYFHQYGCFEELQNIFKLRSQCFWGKQIMEYGLSYKEAFRDTQADQKTLLMKLMGVSSININILAKYCKDVNFDFQTCLKMYLKQVLVDWKLEFEIETNTTTGEKEIVVKPTYKNLLNKCRDIIHMMENTKELDQILFNSVWDSINYYYYEVFLLLLTLIEENSLKQDSFLFGTYRTVFLFLSSYVRISKPREFEKESWYQLHPNDQSLPAIAEYRLPFRLICESGSDPWKIIQPELNIHTYTKWFPVLDALELDKDTLCTLAINQMTLEETISDDSRSGWCVHLRNEKLLADVKSCIENITNLEMLSASLYYVVGRLPPGADQLAAAKLCFLYAKKWHESEKSKNSEAGYNKVQKKYLTISTTHILHIHDLGKPEYLQLVLHSCELVNAIYNDPVILQKNTGNVLKFPDINKAAEEICVLHKLDITLIRMDLLDEWLQPENFVVNVSYNESTVKFEENYKFLEQYSNAEYENFQRACYVIARDISTFGSRLVSIVFDRNPDDSKPTSIRLRALQCLYAVTLESTLEKLTGLSISELGGFMDSLKFVNELEMLGLTYSIDTFNVTDKIEIVNAILSLKNAKAVHLAAKVCRNYKIYNSNVWNVILNNMCIYEMISELSEELPNLYENYQSLDLSVFEKAWRIVLLQPFQKISAAPVEKEIENLEKIMKLINFCPILNQADLNTIRENCYRINRADLVENLDCLDSYSYFQDAS